MRIEMNQLGPLPTFLAGAPEAIALVKAPTGDEVWLVRDHALGRLVLTDDRFSRAAAVGAGAPKLVDVQPAPQSMVSMDGPDHARLRRVVAGAFTGRRAALLGPSIERLADEHIGRLIAAGPPADLSEGLALPLARGVLCSLLGIPAQDSDCFRDHVEVLFDSTHGTRKEKARRRVRLVSYMAGLIERRRQEPGDDLLTIMVRAHDEARLSLAELITMGLTLLTAGYETTAGQIGLSALALASDPVAYGQLRRRPELLPSAVEELLRLTPSTPVSLARVATQPVRLGGVTVAAGEAVVVSLIHGNRDDRAFAEPRDGTSQSRSAAHLTFGHGAHRCLGAPLARLQLQIVLAQLLRHFPVLHLAAGPPDAVAWKEGLITRGLSRLLVEW
ncbi:cytochrome P450 [Streptomyces sp. NPDC050147]|uniref:cytochrome P450 n=1 Tax=Streptomyces sp. NPDC050147 TaxID=3155513 RepID=UPI003415DA9D